MTFLPGLRFLVHSLAAALCPPVARWVVLVCLLAGVGTLAAQPPTPPPPAPSSWERQHARWQAFNHYHGRFGVRAPGPLEEKADTVHTPVGDLVYHTLFFQPPDPNADNAVYMVSYCDYDPAALHSDSTALVEELFEATLESAALSVRGNVLYSDAISLDGYPGKVWRIDYRDGRASIRTRAFVVANRYYAIQTVSRRELGLNPWSDQFLESFHLLSDRPTTPLPRAKRRRRG